MCYRHQRLDDGKPTAIKPNQDPGVWLGSSQQLDKIAIKEVTLLSTRVTVVDTARYLGVVLDRQLSLDAHVTAVCIGAAEAATANRKTIVGGGSSHKSRRLYQAARTIATQYCTACLIG